jgi:DNA-binding transcriptional LysR family regulator
METTAIDYALLAVFVAVADQASFSKAARRLGVGKGTVSRAIARLERLVGVELIHRTTHTVALSTAGIALYERSAPHLAALDQAVTRLPERAEQPSGQLRLTAPHDLGVMLLPELLTQFSLRHPAISFDVRLTNLRVDLVAEGFDLAIRASSAPLKDSTLTVRKLGSTEIRYYAAPSYLARRGEPRELGEPRHEWVILPAMLRLMRAPRGFRPRFASDDFFLIRDLLREGAGIGALPAFVAEPFLGDGTLVPVLAGERLRTPGGYFLLYPSSGQVPRKVTAFRDFLVERLKTRPIDV